MAENRVRVGRAPLQNHPSGADGRAMSAIRPSSDRFQTGPGTAVLTDPDPDPFDAILDALPPLDAPPSADPDSPQTGVAVGASRPGRLGLRTPPVPSKRNLREWAVIVVCTLAVAMIVRATVVQAFYIPSESMVPTLKVGDRLLVEKVSYRVRDVRRGEIVVFKRPPRDPDVTIKDLIKRVIGLPGETIEARDGIVYINNKRLDERYLPPGTITDNLPRQTIPVDQYWVMGDNRGNSWDSRRFGPIDRRILVGRAIVRVFPPSRIGGL